MYWNKQNKIKFYIIKLNTINCKSKWHVCNLYLYLSSNSKIKISLLHMCDCMVSIIYSFDE